MFPPNQGNVTPCELMPLINHSFSHVCVQYPNSTRFRQAHRGPDHPPSWLEPTHPSVIFEWIGASKNPLSAKTAKRDPNRLFHGIFERLKNSAQIVEIRKLPKKNSCPRTGVTERKGLGFGLLVVRCAEKIRTHKENNEKRKRNQLELKRENTEPKGTQENPKQKPRNRTDRNKRPQRATQEAPRRSYREDPRKPPWKSPRSSHERTQENPRPRQEVPKRAYGASNKLSKKVSRKPKYRTQENSRRAKRYPRRPSRGFQEVNKTLSKKFWRKPPRPNATTNSRCVKK